VNFCAKQILEISCSQIETKHLFSLVGDVDNSNVLLLASGKRGLNYYCGEELT
jgi:hypothetical protein